MSLNIYALNLTVVVFIIITTIIVWYFLGRVLPSGIWKAINAVFFIASVYIVLRYSVLGRTPSDEHTFIFTSEYYRDYVRDLVMNALLYVPLGLSLTVLIGPWSVLAGMILSLLVEVWQYFSGAGVAEVTDIIFNTLGAVIGTIPYFILKLINKKKRQ